MNYSVRKATTVDLVKILEIYDGARHFMAETGNPTQWGTSNPARSLLEGDIAQGNLYVITENSDIHGVFAFILGDDPTYAYIEDGEWKSSESYGTIHRIAGDGSGGIVKSALEFAQSRIRHVRIDTHRNNAVMQHVVAKLGFHRCGIIYQPDGSPRIAYEIV